MISSKARKGNLHGLHPVNLSEIADRICNLYADSAEESGLWRPFAKQPTTISDADWASLKTEKLATFLSY